MDAFYKSWEGENCLVVPSVSIITKFSGHSCGNAIAYVLVSISISKETKLASVAVTIL